MQQRRDPMLPIVKPMQQKLTQLQLQRRCWISVSWWLVASQWPQSHCL
jgi:hypothetical protein